MLLLHHMLCLLRCLTQTVAESLTNGCWLWSVESMWSQNITQHQQVANVIRNIQPKWRGWSVCVYTSFFYLLEYNQQHTGWHIAVKCEVTSHWYLLMQAGITSKLPILRHLWPQICAGCFVNAAESRYVHIHLHPPCYEQHVITEDKHERGK